MAGLSIEVADMTTVRPDSSAEVAVVRSSSTD